MDDLDGAGVADRDRIGSMHLGALRGELSRINFKVLPGKPAQIFIVCPGIATIVGGSPSNTFQSAYEISGHANYSQRRTWDIALCAMGSIISIPFL